jgi:predicted alpha/beta hydrolase
MSDITRRTQRLERERRWLQGAVALGCLVPLGAGLAGVLLGPALTGDQAGIAGDSHHRYLSGLLLGIGIAFLTTIPAIETKGARFRLLTAIVVVGGLGRALGYALIGAPDLPMTLALGMELAVTPLLCLWQARVARAFR